jgi:hypothetical protein
VVHRSCSPAGCQWESSNAEHERSHNDGSGSRRTGGRFQEPHRLPEPAVSIHQTPQLAWPQCPWNLTYAIPRRRRSPSTALRPATSSFLTLIVAVRTREASVRPAPRRANQVKVSSVPGSWTLGVKVRLVPLVVWRSASGPTTERRLCPAIPGSWDERPSISTRSCRPIRRVCPSRSSRCGGRPPRHPCPRPGWAGTPSACGRLGLPRRYPP